MSDIAPDEPDNEPEFEDIITTNMFGDNSDMFGTPAPPESDTEFVEWPIVAVVITRAETPVHYDLTLQVKPGLEHLISVETVGDDFFPEAGQLARLYGTHVVRGVMIDDHVVYYRTPAEQRVWFKEQISSAIESAIEALSAIEAMTTSAAEQAVKQQEESRKYDEQLAARRRESKIPIEVTPDFEWTEDMAIVSGIGGSHERGCRQMISQGCSWWAKHPEADPVFKSFENVLGLCKGDNDDAKALSAAICFNIEGSATGLMHQQAIHHIFHWHEVGSWLAYQTTMCERARERGSEKGQAIQ